MKRNLIWFTLLIVLLMLPFAAASHTDSICETTSLTEDDIAVSLLSFSSEATEGQTYSGTIRMVIAPSVAQDAAENFAVEVGMYPRDSPQALSFLNPGIDINTAGNCVATENFVTTRHVTISPFRTSNYVDIPFTITAPNDADLNGGGSKAYVIQALAFKNCYRECALSTGSQTWTWDVKDIRLNADSSIVTDPFNDGVKNGDETDLDCGGSNPRGCQIGFRCDSVSDCQDGLECKNVGGSSPVCTEPDAPVTEQPGGNDDGDDTSSGSDQADRNGDGQISPTEAALDLVTFTVGNPILLIGLLTLFGFGTWYVIKKL